MLSTLQYTSISHNLVEILEMCCNHHETILLRMAFSERFFLDSQKPQQLILVLPFHSPCLSLRSGIVTSSGMCLDSAVPFLSSWKLVLCWECSYSELTDNMTFVNLTDVQYNNFPWRTSKRRKLLWKDRRSSQIFWHQLHFLAFVKLM